MKDFRNYPVPQPKDLTAANAVIGEMHFALQHVCAFLQDMQAICEKTPGMSGDVVNAIKWQRRQLFTCAKVCESGANLPED